MSASAITAPPEALSESQKSALLNLLAEWIANQPPWSDFPFIVLTSAEAGPRGAAAMNALRGLGNALLVERPIDAQALLAAANAAARAWHRHRDFEARIEARTRELAMANDRLMKEIAERERAQAALTQGRERLDLRREPKEILTRINAYLFEELGFSGNEENYYDPENSYLNRVIDRRTGNPINLSLLYMLLARRLHLPVTGIGLPGHFICRHQSSAAEIFIDAFNGGKFLSKADCVQYLVHANYSLRDDCLAPVSSRRMLLRICGNLHQIYLRLELAEETTRVQRYLVALAR